MFHPSMLVHFILPEQLVFSTIKDWNSLPERIIEINHPDQFLQNLQEHYCI